MVRLIDRTRERYGRLVAVERLPAKSKTDTNARWRCECDCGRSTVAYGQDLARGKVKSCGCLNAERITKHGMSRSHVYNVWKGIWQRCTNPKDCAYPNYGGRGITVCEEWKSFERFLHDMGNRPRGMTIDRIDVNGPYSQENCRWATTKQQANNTRRNRTVTLDGESKTLGEWADYLGIPWLTLRGRLDRYGWSIERALTEPVNKPSVYEHDGRRLTLAEWSKESGIPLDTLRSRLKKLGWPFERAIQP